MLTPDEIDGFRVATSRIIDPVVEYLLKDIARRVREVGQLTSTAAYEAWRLEWMGVGKKEMEKELARLLGISRNKAKKLLRQAAEHGYDLTREQFPHAPAFEENAGLQQIVSAAVEMAGEDLKNITRTEAIGMVTPDGKRVPLADAYHECCDFAFNQVVTGATDYNTAIRQACAGIVKYGVQVTYASGVHTTMEAAVRRNIMGGLGLMVEKIEQANHDALGCDGWEISAHANSAPDHEPIQGKQYPDDTYTALNNSLVRRIGTLNCGHIAFPIILGVNSPQYAEEELRQFREDNARGVAYGGRHYTGYEATQKQREIERAIRTQKRRVILASPDEQENAAIRLQRLRQEYSRFSKGVGLRTEDERLHVSGFGRSEAARATATAKRRSSVDNTKNVPEVPPVVAPAAQSSVTAGANVLVEYAQNATPGIGSITYEDGYKPGKHADEIKIAQWLHDVYGGDIVLLNETNVNGVKRADYLWRGKLWDLKSTTTEKAADSAVRSGLKQIIENPGGIILDYGDNDILIENVEKIVSDRVLRGKNPDLDVMIVSKGKAVKVFRYKKKNLTPAE